MKEKSTLLQIGLNIRKLRIEKGISQQDLAAICNFEKSNLCRIESGNVNLTIKTLNRISKGLGVTIKELVDFIEVEANEDVF